MATPWIYLLLFVAGVVAGALNVVAGGGSFLTLPILIFMGLPAGVANATNRVGVVLQNVGAVQGFHHHKVMDWRSLWWATLPATIGALGGTWLALVIEDRAFEQILALMMILLTLWTLYNPEQSRPENLDAERTKALVVIGFFLVGVYAGFVQAGVGFLVLAVTTLAGLDLVRGNAVKVLTLLVCTLLALAIFTWQGKVAWIPGLVLAGGSLLGGRLGVRLTVLKGHKWVRGVVTGTVIFFALKLLFFR